MFTLNDLHEAIKGDRAAISTSERLTTSVPGELVFPPTVEKGNHVFQVRVEDGAPVRTVLLCSKGQLLNTQEAVLRELIENGTSPFSRINRMRVTYPDGRTFYDYDLPGRAADLHFKLGTLVSNPQTKVVDDPAYAQAVTQTGNDAALLSLSPVSQHLGLWDSRHPSGAKVASFIRGEMYGILALQDGTFVSGEGIENPSSEGWRKDPFSPGYTPKIVSEAKAFIGENNLTDKVKKAKLASVFGLGNAPAHNGSGGVALRDIRRYSVISLPLIRNLRVGTDAENLAVQSVAVAFTLSLAAMSRQVTHYRAGCDLNAVDAVTRIGTTEVETPTLGDTIALLDEAITAAGSTSCGFDGHLYDVKGNPIVLGATTEAADESNSSND